MQHAMRLALIVPALMLTACGASKVDGVRIDPLPANVATACPHPTVFLPSAPLTVAGDEVLVGRVGDALIACEAKRAAAVTAYEDVRDTLGGGE